MKKNFLFGVLALAGLLSSCSHDDTADALQNSESDRVTLTATLPADFATIGTRAMTTPPSLHKLRCILEVWTQGENPVLKHRYERADFSSTNEVNFSFTIDQGTYDCLFWADYVLIAGNDGTKVTVPNEYMHYTDKYYKTTDAANGLKAVSLIADEYAGGYNNNARDAFFGYYKLEKKVASVKKPDIPALTRPLAKLTIKEKNNEENYAYCNGMTATYSVPARFNVLTGTVDAENPLTVTCEKFINNSSTQEIFTDYILTDASSTLSQIAMTFAGIGDTKFQNIDIPAGIPLKRNHKTNATGTLLRKEPKPTNDVLLTFVISDVWETPDEEKDLSAWDGTTRTQPAGYDATTPGTVDITSAAELAWLAKTCSAGTSFAGYTFRLSTDINLNNHEWTPIGGLGNYFEGTFDGQHHTVSNLKCTVSQYSGLFGYLREAEVKDVTVSGDLSFTATSQFCYLGGIAGACMERCTISGCTNRCNITVTDDTKLGYVGGIIGKIQDFTVLSDNTNTGKVSTNNHAEAVAGGIIGQISVLQRDNSITLTNNTYSGGEPKNVYVGKCNLVNGHTLTIDGTPAVDKKPFPVPATE